ncbi:SOS response-associated peptidase [Leptospira sp. WS92.C1]
MCNKFAQSAIWTKSKTFSFVKPADMIKDRYHISHAEGALIILKPGLDYTIEDAMFWLVPSGVRSLEAAFEFVTFNAKSETIFELKSFQEPILHSRCIIPCDAIFESKGAKGNRQPYAIRMKDHEPFGMAGIYSRWKDPKTKESLQTFAVITTKANDLLSLYHAKKRMPVILSPENYESWLDKKRNTKESISELFQIYPSEKMIAYPVSRELLSFKNKLQGERCLEPIFYNLESIL